MAILLGYLQEKERLDLGNKISEAEKTLIYLLNCIATLPVLHSFIIYKQTNVYIKK